jgi:uncharacterized protein YwlG (UPF0340 family)
MAIYWKRVTSSRVKENNDSASKYDRAADKIGKTSSHGVVSQFYQVLADGKENMGIHNFHILAIDC